MSLRREVVVECDYKDCLRRYVYVGKGSSAKALELAKQEGYVKRGVWILCPEHRDVKEILR